jgi:hypothetical protein
MKTIMRTVKLAGALLTIIIIVFTVQLVKNSSAIKTTLEVSPMSAQVFIDGKTAKAGDIKMKPGQHTIEVRKEGFTTHSEAIDIPVRNNYYGVSLSPEDNNEWYSSHSEDSILAEAISGKNTDILASSWLIDFPLLKELPFQTGTGSFEINYGSSDDNKLAPVIYVSAKTPELRREAVRWITTRGHDVSAYVINFRDSPNLLDGGD